MVSILGRVRNLRRPILGRVRDWMVILGRVRERRVSILGRVRNRRVSILGTRRDWGGSTFGRVKD